MCKYCEIENPLDSLAAKWLFDEKVDAGMAQLAFGGVIHPEQKSLHLSVVTSPVITKELLTEQIDIKFCPMCGRKL